MGRTFLETDRLALRYLTADDEDRLLDLDSDPAVMRYLTGGVPTTREGIKAVMARMITMRDEHSGRFGLFVASERAAGRFVGCFLLRPDKNFTDPRHRVELGYRLKREFWGLGYATEGVKALIKNGFENLGVREVFAITMKDNLASRRVMEKCGMTFVREFRHPDFPESMELDVEYSMKCPAGG